MDIPGYQIHKKIGEGAMASVYLAEQESLGRQVALKVLAPALANQRDFTVRFLNEGKIIAYLNHPQIVSVYDLGSHHQHYYLAMELLTGGTLEQRIRNGMRTEQALRLIIIICRSLGFAHRNGVIHRDIKPQNILFRNDDIPVLTDFGIARLMNSDPRLTIPGRTVGSPLYMSPEQICGREIDERADLYAIGILFYEMLTGQPPYDSDQFMDIALMHKTAPIPLLPDDVSVFQPLMDRVMAKEPDDRYASANELIEALERINSENDFARADGPNRLNAAELPGFKMDGAKLHRIGNPDNSMNDATQPSITPVAEAPGVRRRTVLEGRATESSGHAVQDDSLSDSGSENSGALWKKSIAAAVLILSIAGGISFYQINGTSKQVSSTPLQQTAHEPFQPASLKLESRQIENPVQIYPVEPRQDATPTGEKRVDDRRIVDQKIADLLTKAQTQLANYRLSSPAGDNCYETYQHILLLDPTNQAAESLLKKIGGAYRTLAMTNQARGRYEKGLLIVGKGLSLLPEDNALLDLQAELKSDLASQVEQSEQQAQARRIEAQKRIRAAERAAIEKKQRDEMEFEVKRLKEVERQLQELQRSEAKKVEESEVEIDTEKSEAKEKNTSRRNRLFGTF